MKVTRLLVSIGLCFVFGFVSGFEATSEWQVWSEEMGPLPEGLHYRINIQTGLKEAKLIDKLNKENKELQQIPESETGNEKKPEVAKIELNEKQKASMKKINDYLNQIKIERETADDSKRQPNVDILKDFDIIKNLTEIIKNQDNSNEQIIESG